MDEILDLDWVLSHESQIDKMEATLFQKCSSAEKLIIGSAMLYENDIPYQIKSFQQNGLGHFAPVQEIYINEKDFEKACQLLDQLLSGDAAYPKKLSGNYSVEELRTMLDLGENPYREILLKTELKNRGIEIEKEGANGEILFLIFITIIIFLFILRIIN